ncbi:uncharacterized protein G2W53_037681 [Senna tora]|uniref:Uncharacterized protein n=1 Tax=Senna tora TaxID=362788 RepID=A0A834W1F1_9FABA|nr:uncharacterized protein G2W53_037681 [Senna tora]
MGLRTLTWEKEVMEPIDSSAATMH